MSDERLKILQMLEEKKITLDATATLIEALEGQEDGTAAPAAPIAAPTAPG
jgi:hypothetical protein